MKSKIDVSRIDVLFLCTSGVTEKENENVIQGNIFFLIIINIQLQKGSQASVRYCYFS